MTDPRKSPQLTEYEIVRAKKIERNTSRMVELGLLSPSKAKLQVETAWKITGDTDQNIQMSNNKHDVNDPHENNDAEEAKLVAYAPANLVPFLDKILEVASNVSDQDVNSVSF